MITLRQILVPTDFSDHSRQAADYACELAKRFEARIHLLHVVEPLTMAMPSPGAPLPEQLMSNAEEDANNQIEKWLSSPEEQALSVTRCVRRGAPFLEIIRYANVNNIDLIVMGTHGRSGLKHALIGSVAERVVRKASCPVLSVRPDGHQFVMP